MGKDRIKVLHVLTDSNVGGAGRVLTEYLRYADRERYDIKVVLPEGSLLIPSVAGLGYEVREMKHGRDRSFEPASVRELAGIIREERPYVLHSHSCLSARIAGYMLGVKVKVFTRHTYPDASETEAGFFRRKTGGLINNILSDGVICVADAVGQYMLDTGVSEKKIFVVLNGASALRQLDEKEKSETRKMLGIGPESPVLTVCGRLTAVKGQKYAIKAMGDILKAYSDAVLLLLGGGEDEPFLRELAEKSGYGESIVFAGFRDDVAPFLNITDILVNSSEAEATSMAIAEAMSLGIPVIASDCGGNTGIVKDGFTGYIVPVGSPERIAQAAVRMLGHADETNEMRRNAMREFTDRFSAECMARGTEQVYEKIIGSKKR